MQIAQTLLSDVQGGTYAVGSMLPTEAELCVQFGVSRFTVREAIRQLVGMGILTRQPGVGTTVIKDRSAQVFRQVIDRLEDLQTFAAETQLHVVDRYVAEVEDQTLATRLGATPGQLWLQLNCLRWAAESHHPPICHTSLYLAPAFRSITGLAGRGSKPVFRLIEEQFGERIVEVRQQVTAGALSEGPAQLLGVRVGLAALVVERLYINHRGDVVELAISTHPGHRYQHQQTFRRDY